MKLPDRALYDRDITTYVNKLNIPYFRGVFMRDTLPQSKPKFNECGVVNLDLNKNRGTHWVAYKKRGNSVEYFDSFGNLKPPRELVDYLGRDVKIFYKDRYQNFDSNKCGHLCLEFLYKSK